MQSLIEKIKRIFNDCGDFAIRDFPELNISVLYIINLCDKKYITDCILKIQNKSNYKNFSRKDFQSLISSLPLSECKNENEITDKILSGNAVFISQDSDGLYVFSADAKSEDGRSISEPESESVVRGPRQGFIENAQVNVTLLRKIIKSQDLKVLNYQVGKTTKTDIKIVYLQGTADENILNTLKEKIESLSMNSCVDSGNLELKLQSKKYNFFSDFGNSEKPDKIASKILAGRIAIICDGSPVVLTAPYVFTESIQSTEDYLKSVYYATFIRILRIVSLILSIYLPAIYIAIYEFHKGAIPYSMFKLQSQTRSNIPFDIFTEMIIVLIVFEIIREVGLRMPKAVGDALSVVGGLILGDAAIKAGITSETVIVIAALTGICNFMNPPFMNINVLLRLLCLITAKIFGFFGISFFFVLTLCILCNKNSFGVPYMTPFAPISKKILYDTVLMNPYQTVNKSGNELNQ